MSKEHFKLEAIKSILVEMTANDKLPMDMTELDIHTIAEQAETRLETDKHYQRWNAIDKLAHYISDEDVNEAYNTLIEAEESGFGDGGADFHVTIYQPFENKFTVNELLAEII